MRVGELLDADVGEALPRAGAALAAGWRWWTGELRDMLPAGLLGGGTARPAWTARRQPDGRYRLTDREGRTRVHAAGEAPVKAALVLPPGAALLRRTPAPPVPDRDLRRMLLLDVDRLTPFRAEDIHLAVARLPAGEGAVRQALLAVAPRDRLGAVLAEARAEGVEPLALVAGDAEGAWLDLLPAVRAAAGERPVGSARPGWWAAVAVLLALNVAAWIVRDIRETDALQALVDAQRPEVARVAALRTAVTAEAARRAALAVALAEDEPLAALGAASRALPAGAWVQRATVSQGSLRLAGFHQPGVDVVAALRREPLFAEVEPTSDAGDTPATGGSDPFDVTIRLATPAPSTALLPLERDGGAKP